MSKLSTLLHKLTGSAAQTPPPAADQVAVNRAFNLFEQLKSAVTTLSPAGKAWIDEQVQAHMGPFGGVAAPVVHALEDKAVAALLDQLKPMLDDVQARMEAALGANAERLEAALAAAIQAALAETDKGSKK